MWVCSHTPSMSVQKSISQSLNKPQYFPFSTCTTPPWYGQALPILFPTFTSSTLYNSKVSMDWSTDFNNSCLICWKLVYIWTPVLTNSLMNLIFNFCNSVLETASALAISGIAFTLMSRPQDQATSEWPIGEMKQRRAWVWEPWWLKRGYCITSSWK